MSEDAPPVKVEEHPNTKLILVYTRSSIGQAVRDHLMNMPAIIQRMGYDFTFEMPVVECKYTEKKEKYLNWRGKERERVVYDAYSYETKLIFSKELSDEELRFWRIWKLGWLSRHLSNYNY